jgi:hypothetical protein
MNVNYLSYNLVACGDFTNLKVKGNDWNVGDINTDIPSAISIAGNSSNLYANVDYISIPGRIISADVGGNVVFRNKKSVLKNSSAGTVDTQMFQFINGCLVDLEGDTLISSGFENMIEFLGSSSGKSNFKYISGVYRCVYIDTYVSVWHYCENSITTSTTAPVVGLQTKPSGNIIHTIGGYMNTGSTNVIEVIDDGNHNQFTALRLLGSMLVGTNLAIFNSSTLACLTVSTQPSSANNGVTYTTGLNGEVKIVPTGALLVDAAVI